MKVSCSNSGMTEFIQNIQFFLNSLAWTGRLSRKTAAETQTFGEPRKVGEGDHQVLLFLRRREWCIRSRTIWSVEFSGFLHFMSLSCWWSHCCYVPSYFHFNQPPPSRLSLFIRVDQTANNQKSPRVTVRRKRKVQDDNQSESEHESSPRTIRSR